MVILLWHAEKGWDEPTLSSALCQNLLLVLALLVGHGAGGLAGGLARGLALAAAAMGGALLQGGPIERLNMSHDYLLQFKRLVYYITLFHKIQYNYFFDISRDRWIRKRISWIDSSAVGL